MNWLPLAVAGVRLLAAVTTWFEQQQWYQEGLNDGIAAQQAADKAAADALRARYDAIAAAPLSADDAAGRLLARGSVPGASGA